MEMHPEIAKRITGVTRKIRRLIDDAVNKHAGYGYASIDKFYEDVGPIMADEGLFLILDEQAAHTQLRGSTNWLELEFNVYVCSETGHSYGPVKRSQQVRADNSTAYGSCASYLEKYFLRQLFKIPTGEKGEDLEAQKDETLPKRTKQEPKQKPTQFDIQTSAAKRVELISSLAKVTSTAALIDWNNQTFDDRKRLIQQDYDAVKSNYEKIQEELKGNRNG
jgi:ERF superfamily